MRVQSCPKSTIDEVKSCPKNSIDEGSVMYPYIGRSLSLCASPYDTANFYHYKTMQHILFSTEHIIFFIAYTISIHINAVKINRIK